MSPQLNQNIKKEIKKIATHLRWHFKFKLEGSASPEELAYLIELARKHNVKLVGEVGFNAGFSSYSFLAADPDIRIISFDIGGHSYVKIAKRYIDKKFPERHTLVYGDSKITVPKFKKDNPEIYFDLVFIDGSHKYEDVKSDILNLKQLSTEKTLIIVDDLTPWLRWGKGPARAWREAVESKLIVQDELYKDGRPINDIQPPGKRIWGLGHFVF